MPQRLFSAFSYGYRRSGGPLDVFVLMKAETDIKEGIKQAPLFGYFRYERLV